MELSEAKEIASKTISKMNEEKKDSYILKTSDFKEVVGTLLKALDNSISKEYHEMVVKELNDIINDLKVRLDNSINKDEVRQVRDNLEMKDYYLSRDGADDLTRLLGEEVEE